jgi:hypothetical protein
VKPKNLEKLYGLLSGAETKLRAVIPADAEDLLTALANIIEANKGLPAKDDTDDLLEFCRTALDRLNSTENPPGMDTPLRSFAKHGPNLSEARERVTAAIKLLEGPPSLLDEAK